MLCSPSVKFRSGVSSGPCMYDDCDLFEWGICAVGHDNVRLLCSRKDELDLQM